MRAAVRAAPTLATALDVVEAETEEPASHTPYPPLVAQGHEAAPVVVVVVVVVVLEDAVEPWLALPGDVQCRSSIRSLLYTSRV